MDIRPNLVRLLRLSERYTRTDMVYLATTGFWSNAGILFVSGASFLLYIVFGNFLPKEVYGNYQYLLSVGAIVGAFTLTGMNSAVTRAVALGKEGAMQTAMLLQLKWAALPLLGAWAMGAYYVFRGDLTLGWGLILIGIFVPLNNALNTYAAFLQAKLDFKRGFLYSLFWNVPYYLVVAVVAVFFPIALILLAANLISQAVGLFIAYRSTIRTYKPNSVPDPEISRYGGHLSVMGLIGSIAAQIDTVLAFHLLGPAQLAIYSFATAVPDRVGALFKFIPAAAFPKFVGKSPGEIRQGLGRRLFIGTLLSALLAFGYVAIAYPFFSLFFPVYLESVPYSQWYALTLVSLMSGVLANALVAAGNVRSLYIFNTVNPLVQIVLQAGGILLFGLMGLVFGRILASVFTFAFGIVLYWRLR